MPLLVLASLFTFWRLGRAIRPIAPARWDELRPEPGRGKINRARAQRLKRFIETEEYESLGSPTVNQLERQYRRLERAVVIALIGAVLMVAWAVT